MLSPRTPALVVAFALVLLTAARPAGAAPGDLDLGFGTGGLVQVDLSVTTDEARDVVIQPDGKILAVGSAGSHAVLLRYAADGIPDPSFGSDGIVTVQHPVGSSSSAVSVALDATGRIVTAGSPGVSVRRHLANGDPDVTFGMAGTAQVPPIDGQLPTPVAIAIQSDGKIVVAGHVPGPGPQPFPTNVVFVMRFDEQGVRDPSFGGDGVVTVPVILSGSLETTSLLVQADDRVVVGVQLSGLDGMLLRLTTDGQLDESFDIDGMTDTSFLIRGLASQPDGKLVAVGQRNSAQSGISAAVGRFLSHGAPDWSFDDDGIFDYDPAQRNDDLLLPPLRAVGIQADGKIVVSGMGLQAFTVARLTPNGAFDPGYGHDGIATSAFGARRAFQYAMALQDDGGAILAGTMDSALSLVRHLGSVCGDATPDADEPCDDGNRVDGDGCDGTCTPTACGNGVVTAGEQCDDGNTADGDCCAASCQLEGDGAPCDDANQCSATATCAAGICFPGPTSVSCDDGDACTEDVCDPPTGICRSEPLRTLACHQKNVALGNLEQAFRMGSSRFGSSDADLFPPIIVFGDSIAALSSAGDDTVIEVFDTATGARRAALPDASHLARFLGPIAALGTDLLVVTGSEFDPEVGRIDRYDGTTFTVVQTFVDPTPATPGFGSTVLGHAGKVIVRDRGSHVVEVFDAASGDRLHTLAAPGGDPHGVFGVRLLGFGDHQVLVGDAGAVHLFDLDTGVLVRTFVDPTPGEGAFGAVIAVHGDDVLVGGRHEGRVYALDPTTGAVRGTFDDPTPQVNTRFGDVVIVAGDDVVIGRDASRAHVFDATTRALRVTILDPLPSDGVCFGRAILPVFGDRLAIADPCFSGGDTSTGQVYLFDQVTGALRTIVANPNHDSDDRFTVVGSWQDTLFTYFMGFSQGTIVAHRPCANGAPAFGAKCLDGPCVDPAFCPGPCDFLSCGTCTRCDTASADCIAAPRDACTDSARPARTTLRLSRHRPRIDWHWKAGAEIAPGGFGTPTESPAYGICLYEEDASSSRLVLSRQLFGGWRRTADGRFVFADRARRSDIDRLALQSGRAGRAGITARLTAPEMPLPTFPVTKRLRIQLQHQDSNACWESVHDPADAGRNDGRDFRGRATAATP